MAVELSTYGMTVAQAKIYLYLLTNGPSPARTISKSLGIHRVDVYQKLRELQELGSLEMYLDYPKRYGALEPSSVIATLLRRNEQKLESFRLRSAALVPRLVDLRKYLGNNARGGEREKGSNNLYKLVLGQNQYILELKQLIRNADREVVRIVSSGGIIRGISSHMDEVYSELKSRGVPVRLITEVIPTNAEQIKKLSKVVELRHMKNVNLRFTAVDKSISMLSARYDEYSTSLDSPEDAYLLLVDSKLTEALCFFFEHLWTTAKPVSQKLFQSA